MTPSYSHGKIPFFSVIGNVKECETRLQKRLYAQENIVLKDSSVESTVHLKADL